jgi:hypothetical protein
MCTVVILRRPDHRWPLILGTNRDEMKDRPWRPPGRHWPDRPEIVAGMDELAGGSWLGINDTGVVAGALNRRESLGNDPTLRSRGELVLEALGHADAVDAAHALSELDPRAYRSFNLFVADNRDAYWLRSLGAAAERVELFEIPEGFSMLTAWGLNAPESARTRHFLPLFEQSPPPDPDRNSWQGWKSLLASRSFDAAAGPTEAMCVVTDRGFGTLSSSVLALESPDTPNARKIWQFSASPGATYGYRTVTM